MDIDALLRVIEASGLATRIRDSLYIFPLIESAHVLGLALVFGTILVIDLRLLGIASMGRSFRRIASDTLKWTWIAFALTAFTGALMFTTNPRVYYHNFYFRTKMLLLLLGGINMVAFELSAGRTVHTWDNAASVPRAGKVVAALSLTIWIAVIFMGRLIGFSTKPGVVVEPPASVNFDDFLQGEPDNNSGSPTNAPGKN